MRLAVTGISGTIGTALAALAAEDPRVGEVVGVTSQGGGRSVPGVRLVQADVRDRAALERAFAGADAVVHLAYALYGVRQHRRELDAVNVEGTANAYRAARDAGAGRFVQASSVAVYGLERGRSRPYAESDPVRPDPRHFYVEQKARIELLLRELEAAGDGPAITFLRPCGVAGPHALGGAGHGAGPMRAAGPLARALFGAGLRPPLPPPGVPLQFIHEADAAAAFLRAALDGPSGTFNLAPDDHLTGEEAVRALGFPALPVPARVRDAAYAAAGAVPVLPFLMWAQMLRFPLVADGGAARTGLGWAPSMTSAEALASTRAAWSA